MARLGAVLHCGTNLVEKVQSLVNLALSIGWVGTLLRRHSPAADSRVAGVHTAARVAIAVGSATGRIARTGEAVPDRTRLPSSGLTSLLLALLPSLAALPWLLAWLTRMTGLPVAGELAGLERLAPGLAATSGLTLSRLRVGTSAEAGEFVAQAS